MSDSQIEGPDNTRFELVIDFLKARFLSVVGVLLLLVAGGVYFGVDPDVPRFWEVFGFAAVFASPIAYMTGSTVVKWLYNPRHIFLIDLSAAAEKGALYRLPEAEFRDMEVLDGQLDRLADGLYVGKRVDRENGRVAGTWRGTLTDRDLLLSLRKVRECRGRLEKDARRGFVLDSSMFIIVRRAVHETTKHVINTFEKGTLPDDGDALGAAIDDELDEFGVTDELDKQIDEMAEKLKESADAPDDLEGFEFVSEPESPERNGAEKTPSASDEAAEVKL